MFNDRKMMVFFGKKKVTSMNAQLGFYGFSYWDFIFITSDIIPVPAWDYQRRSVTSSSTNLGI